MQDWEQRLSSASQRVEVLVQVQQDMGETMDAFVFAFVKSPKFVK